MFELSLFSGAGGGLLGSHLLGWKVVGYVEWDDYCQRVIRQRIIDGILSNAPIYGDIRAFIDDGYAKRYRGMVDIVTAGFPCQPFAAGGKQRAGEDPRNMWPETIRAIREVRPEFVLLENTPMLLAGVKGNQPYIARVIEELSGLGYVGRWGVLSAASLGFYHRRDRLWVIAHSCEAGRSRILQSKIRQFVAPMDIQRRTKKPAVALDAICCTLEEAENRYRQTAVCGSDDGLANRVDRLGAVGNGQVPSVVKTVWERFGG